MGSEVTGATGQSGQSDQAWWTERFSERLAEAAPPLFRRRSKVYRRRSQQIREPFSAALTEQLGRTGTDAAGAGAERLHAVFLAAVAGVLFRYLGTDGPDAAPERIAVGAPWPVPTTEPGQALPLLLTVSGTMPFGDLVDEATASIAESAKRLDFSVPALLDALAMSEVVNRHPLFAVGLRIEGYHPAFPELRHDATVTVEGGQLAVEYNANVHDEDAVVRFARHVSAFLTAGLASPGTAVQDLAYLDPEEQRLLLDDWSGGAVGEPAGKSLHGLFDAAVPSFADAPAIIGSDEEVISYRELQARANRLANHLRAAGIGRGSRVALCHSPSPDLLIGVLAILKSGAAVVPVVPTFPVSRNRMTVADAAVDAVVTDTTHRHQFEQPGPPLVLVDEHAEHIAAAADTDPGAGTGPADPVYVLFTSGSTGRPKGVELVHRTLVNLIEWQRDRGLDPAGARTLFRTSIGFDISFQEIFSTLAYGGCLVVATDEVRDDVSLLPDAVERHSIARLYLPAVALDQMSAISTLGRRPLTSLREVIVAGEQLQISMPIRRFFHDIDCRLDNQYGPTETHVVTAYALEGASTRWAEAPAIGKPVRNVRAYILDAGLNPVPAGVPGEIYIGGIAATGHYLQTDSDGSPQDELQGKPQGGPKDRFQDDPFQPGDARMYRTGDRGRFLADGNIEFLGRVDDQVKIRGYRIELGDVEAHLLRVPGIRHAAAAVHTSPALGPQLAAYVVTEVPGVPEAAEIRRRMLQDLPGHMVPAATGIVYLDTLPLTATGKVNRRALPAPKVAAQAGLVQAEGDLEKAVAGIWSQALGVPQVGRDDDFIELGGHSLVAIQVVARLNELYSVALPLRSFLRGTTVAVVAQAIEASRSARSDDPDAAGQDVTQAPDELQEITLPNGRRIVCLQPAETRYLYLDVVEHQTYERGGIRFPENGVVFDVGAHVGLFALHALDKAPGSRVYAFEPCEPLFGALTRNTEDRAEVARFPFALGAQADTAELTYYPNLTGMTSFHPDQDEERTLLGGILRNLDGTPETRGSELLAESKEYMSERLLSRTYRAERRRLSDVLAQTGVDRVDLLKIDVQKAESEVLAGIDDADWPRIGQLAVEVHDLGGRLAEIRALLAGKGYRVTVEQDPLHAGTPVHFVYAVRD